MNRYVRGAGFILIVFLTLILSCDQDDIRFEGINLRGPGNQDYGTLGSHDIHDWQNDGTLSKSILKLFAFDDTDLEETETSTDVYISAYPNPVRDHAYLKFYLSHNSRVRIVIVNESFKVLFQRAFTGSKEVIIDLSDKKKFQNEKIVRVYYSISSETDLNFYVGHGDILICRTQNCFDLVT